MSAPRPELTVCLVDLSWPGYRSLALGYLQTYAQSDERLKGRVGFSTVRADSKADPWWVAFRVAELTPDVVGFSVTCWNARQIHDVCSILARVTPETTIVLGGPEVGPIAEDVLVAHPAVDVVVRGEGEITFAEILLAALGGDALWGVEGASARRGDDIVSADDRPLIPSLDDIPSPYLSGVLEPIDGASYIESYRGCPHRCGYCFEGKGYGTLRHFSAERIAAEVAIITESPLVRSFSFVDPVFNLTSSHLRTLADVLEPHARLGVRLHTIEVDVERIDADSAATLRRAGVASVETGPQSVGAAALETCRRAFDRERFAAGVKACQDAGIDVECDLIIGLPEDTEDDVLAGLQFAASLEPAKVQISTLHVLPGTDLWERAEDLGLIYNETPPHEIIATRTLDFATLRRLEAFGFVVASHHRARIPQNHRS